MKQLESLASPMPQPNRSRRPRHLSAAAQARIKNVPKHLRKLVKQLELAEISLGNFVIKCVSHVEGLSRGGNSLIDADALLEYTRTFPPLSSDVDWLVDLLERYGCVVMMRGNGGRFASSTLYSKHSLVAEGHTLEREVYARFADRKMVRSSRTLFDRSIQQQTMRASRYAKANP
jgi:hypothetical protein